MDKKITDFRNKINYVAFLLFFSCAAIMSPPGGAKDETPPELTSTIPKNKATNQTPSSPMYSSCVPLGFEMLTLLSLSLSLSRSATCARHS